MAHPAPWRGALVCWALVVAVSAPIVMGREFDFNPVVLLEERMPTSVLGSVPGFVVVWVAQVALTLVLGILWFDWLFGAPRLDLHAWIVTPLALSALAMASVAIYQLFVDVSFLNETVYGNIGRASGTMFDANVCGTIAALWIGGTILWAQRLERWRPYLLIVGVTATWLAVWASGSRTAFAAAVLVTAFSLATQYAARGVVPGSRRVPRLLLAAGLVIGLLVLLANADLGRRGPGQAHPGHASRTVGRIGARLRRRDVEPQPLRFCRGRDDPGVSALRSRRGQLPPPRLRLRRAVLTGRLTASGQRAELVPASACRGGPAWKPRLDRRGWFSLRASSSGATRSSPPAAWTLRGMLLAFAMISLVGMPGQEVSVTMTFWTLAFWYASLIGVPSRPPAAAAWRSWAVIGAIVVAHAAGTAHLAATELRVPSRAQHAGLAVLLRVLCA